MFSLDLFAATTAATAVRMMLGEECAVLEEHLLQRGLQEVDRSLAVFDDLSPSSPGIPGYEPPPQMPGSRVRQHPVLPPGIKPMTPVKKPRKFLFFKPGERQLPASPLSLEGSEYSPPPGDQSWGRDRSPSQDRGRDARDRGGSGRNGAFQWPEKSLVTAQQHGSLADGERNWTGEVSAQGQTFSRELSLQAAPQRTKQSVLPAAEHTCDVKHAPTLQHSIRTEAPHAQPASLGKGERSSNSVHVQERLQRSHVGGDGRVSCSVSDSGCVVSPADTSLPSVRDELDTERSLASRHHGLTSPEAGDGSTLAQGPPLRPSPSSSSSRQRVSAASSSSLWPSEHQTVSMSSHQSEEGTHASKRDSAAAKAASKTVSSTAVIPTKTVQFQVNLLTEEVEEGAGSIDEALAESQSADGQRRMKLGSSELGSGDRVVSSLSPHPSLPRSESATTQFSSESYCTQSRSTSPQRSATNQQFYTDPVKGFSSSLPQPMYPGTSDDVGDEVDDVAGVQNMMEFVEMYFNDHERDSGSWRRKKQDETTSDYLSHEEMLNYNRTGLMATSLTRLPTPHLTHLACIIFKDLTRFIRQELRDDAMLPTLQGILRSAIEHVELRDEILCQLIKQTNQNPEPECLRHAWLVMCLCAASFSPSKRLYKYVLSYVKQSCDHPEVGGYALMCHRHLTTPRAYARKCPPSAVEVMNTQQQTGTVVRVHLLDGKTKAVSVLPRDTTLLVLHKVASRVGLQSVDGWALYEMTKDCERFIRNYEYIADVIAQWESSHRVPSPLTRVDWHGGKQQRVAVGGGPEAMFLFRKRVYRHVDDLSRDPVERHLLYAEAVHKVVKLDEYNVTEETALELAGLQLYVIWGAFEENKSFKYGEPDQYLCRRILSGPEKDWPQLLGQAHQKVGLDVTEGDAEALYVCRVQQSTVLYGSVLFAVRHTGLWAHAHNALLAVNVDGVKFVNAKDKAILHDFQYGRLDAIYPDPDDPEVLNMEIRNESEEEEGRTGCAQKAFLFHCPGEGVLDLTDLLTSYCLPPLRRHLHPHPDQDLAGPWTQRGEAAGHEVCEGLTRCRRMLADSHFMQPPQPDGSAGFLWNAIRRLARTKQTDKHQADIVNNGAGAEERKLGGEFWSCSRTPLRQSLCRLPDVRLEETAVNLFSSVLLYTDVCDSGVSTGDEVTLLQNLAVKSMENDGLCDECYLQLVKQTTGQPDASSTLCLRSWQIMTVLCVTVTPVSSLVLRYVKLHLQKCATDISSPQGKYARFALRCLTRNLQKKRRKYPPSVREIKSVIQRKPLKQTLWLLTGEQCQVQLDSAASCREVIRKVKVKVGMRSDAAGFALYEVTGDSASRAMAGDVRLCDVISRWERSSRQGSGQDCRLDFKKRLFLTPYVNLKDPAQCELVCHQLIQDMFEERIPLTAEDATQLCALKIQSEMCSIVHSAVDHSSVMRILPRAMRGKVKVEEVERKQRAVSHMTSHQALVAFLRVLMEGWTLFGATLFPVSQTTSTSLPKEMMLAVHGKGVTLLEPLTLKSVSTFAFSEVQQGGGSVKAVLLTPAKGAKVTCQCPQASQIVQLVQDYADEVHARVKRPLPRKDNDSCKAATENVHIKSLEER